VLDLAVLDLAMLRLASRWAPRSLPAGCGVERSEVKGDPTPASALATSDDVLPNDRRVTNDHPKG
jgi:hypothetical protein